MVYKKDKICYIIVATHFVDRHFIGDFMAHDASENNPKKEIVTALVGIVLLLVLIAGIAVSAWLRPAGNHEPVTVSATEAGKALDEANAAAQANK